jgi:polyisoprenyl-teichoic acid--peptidoglycan teichoic acid transferase
MYDWLWYATNSSNFVKKSPQKRFFSYAFRGILSNKFMENFRKFKAPHKTARGAVDGFAPSNRPMGRQVRPGPGTPLSNNGSARLDNFSRTDGFRSNAQATIRSSSAQTAQPGRNPMRSNDGRIQLDLPPTGAPKKKKRSKKKLVLRSFFSLVVILVLGGSFFFGNAYLKARKIFGGGGGAPALNADVDPTKLKGEGDGRVNVLMLGKGGAGHEGADLTDTIIVASIDPIQKEMSMMSLPRDFWVKTDKGESKINAVYANAKNSVLAGKKTSDLNKRAEDAGEAAVETEVEEVLGIPIHYYVMVDFAAFEKAINIVGGVDLNVDKDGVVYEKLWNETTRKNYTLDVKEGPNHFDGQRALFYSRSRHTSARGDFDRAERQRKIIVALKDKVTSAGTYSNPVKVTQLINDFGDHVHSNLSTGEILRVYDIVKSIDSSKIGSVGLADPPNNYIKTGMYNGQSIVMPTAGMFQFSDIQNFVRNTLRDGYLRKENANIAVFNGSTITGLAGKRATELKSFGYSITTVDNAPTKNYEKTLLIDFTGGKKKYTQHYLEQRLKVTAVTQLPDSRINPNGADFVIILGQNESSN